MRPFGRTRSLVFKPSKAHEEATTAARTVSSTTTRTQPNLGMCVRDDGVIVAS